MLKRIVYRVQDLLAGRKDAEPCVVALMDGGICSQMYQYLLGQLFAQKGWPVFYDLTFYKECGMDMNGQFVRNFDLEKAFSGVRVNAASEEMIRLYKKRFFYNGNYSESATPDCTFLDKKPPLYLGGYYLLPPEVLVPVFRELYRPSVAVLDEPNRRIHAEISAQAGSVAVHVRRGDLKEERESHGSPASLEYFRRAVALMRERVASPHFYFFSDEPQWVAAELVPQLGVADCYRLVDINGSDKGYMDLIQIAACAHQITSKGSLGKFGAMLADNDAKIVAFSDAPLEHYWGSMVRNPVYL